MLVNHICKAPVNQKLPQNFADLLNLVHECPLSLLLSELECVSHSSFKADFAFLTAHKTEDQNPKCCAVWDRPQWTFLCPQRVLRDAWEERSCSMGAIKVH